MARMAIDDMFMRDPRVAVLAKICGISLFDARGRLLEVWSICYDRVSAQLSELVIDTAAQFEGFAKHMVEAELALRVDSKVLHVSGAKHRIKYLEAKSDAGRKGGIKSGESRRNQREANAKQNFKQGEALTNPPDPVPLPDTDLDPDRDRDLVPEGASRAASLSPDFRDRVDRNAKAAVQAAARRVLNRLTETNGIAYTSPEHLELVETRLREGRTEYELRAVIVYCAHDRKWAESDEMRENLSPQALFGPSLARYLDPAKSRYAVEIAAADQEVA